jgi:hypothetical protein
MMSYAAEMYGNWLLATKYAEEEIPAPKTTLPANHVAHTPHFKRWFGPWDTHPHLASKVVNEHGHPLRVYHGTTAPERFKVFAVGEPVDDGTGEFIKTGSGADPRTFLGSHFAREPQVANKFASGLYGERQGQGVGGRVMPVYLNLRNPHHTSDNEMMEEMLHGTYNHHIVDDILERDGDIEETGHQYETDPKYRADVNRQALEEEGNEDDPSFGLSQDMADQYRNRLHEAGHDGIVYDNDVEGGKSYIAFHPHQIKSASGNAGSFDPNDPRIGYARLMHASWERVHYGTEG